MELPPMNLRAISSFLLCTILLSSMDLSWSLGSASNVSYETDRLALINFKHLITNDPLQSLSSWNHTLHFCQWKGVTCGRQLPQRVTALNLSGQSMVGPISPYIANLTFLSIIDLANNSFHGMIPEEIGRLSHLQSLILANNTFTGEIPANLTHCSELKVLNFRWNQLTGRIPTELGSLLKLTFLSLRHNSLTGIIPPSLGNLSSLTALGLSRNSLEGSMPEDLGRLVRLRHLAIAENELSGRIPEEIGRLSRLQSLILANNTFTGEIPANLTHCSELEELYFWGNQLTGRIPTELGSLLKLTSLSLRHNSLTGIIPPSLGNLSSLTVLDLTCNRLEGSIPEDLGRLVRLSALSIGLNELSGTIPPQLYNISSITILGVVENKLHGNLPPNVGLTLPNLRGLYFSLNQFTGSIPVSLSNASGLVIIDLSNNIISGSVPMNFGSLKGLNKLHLGGNQLGLGKAHDLNFLDSLTNCSRLLELEISNNYLSGVLPDSMANLSTQLRWLNIESNRIFGNIPSGIQNLVGLTALIIGQNFLTGNIPVGVGKLNKVEVLLLGGNELSGQIPSSLGNISRLYKLFLHQNNLIGSIPSSLGNCTYMKFIRLGDNNFSGSLPKQLFSFTSLIELHVGNNFFTGNLQMETGNLKSLRTLNVSNNKLSGEIPSLLGNCLSLEYLWLDGNFFQGSIPSAFSTLRGLQSLDLSCNILSGKIPQYLENLSALQYLNLSFNNFEGELSKQGVFGNASQISVLGNSKLCGGIQELQLPACSHQVSKKGGISLASKVKISIISVVMFLISLSCSFTTLYWVRKSRRKPLDVPSMEDPFMNVSYAELYKATDGFSSANLIGSGSFGSVYKGSLDRDGIVIAVKVLNLQQQGATRSFMAECEALRNVRHRNLIKILTCCSSIDFKGNEFMALVFEYMPNGSLSKWLHGDGHDQLGRNLNFIQRLNIAIDVANALDYLHHHCQTPIIHCDLKPDNILLDDDMIAHVGDFGLARFLSDVPQTSSVGVKGSTGYIAPEYAMGAKASTQGDVYSYGILLLEMITGKGPTDDMFKDDLSLHHFAKLSLPERVMDIVDPVLLEEAKVTQGSGNHTNTRKRMHACLISMVRIGVLCSAESPRERMDMKGVVTEMHKIKNLYLGVRIQQDEQVMSQPQLKIHLTSVITKILLVVILRRI